MNFDYSQATRRINTFLNSLDDTHINFLYFHASALDQPLVKTIFKKCQLLSNQVEYYLIPGHSTNFIYAYQKSDLQTYVLLDIGPTPSNTRQTPAYLNNAFKALIVNPSTSDAIPAYIGNHIDFSFYRQRDNNPLIKVHYTVYTQWDSVEAIRNIDECNFKLNQVDFTHFENTQCLNTSGLPNGRTCQNEIGHRTDIVKVLTQIVAGETPTAVTSTYQIGPHGGKYRVKNNKKTYQRGGANGYPFIERLIPYIVDTFLRPLLHTGYETCSVIYDSHNELNQNGADNFVFFYNFEQGNMQQRFFLDAKLLTAAAFIEDPNHKQAQTILIQYRAMIEKKLLNIAGKQDTSIVSV